MFEGRPEGPLKTIVGGKEYGKAGAFGTVIRHTWILSHRTFLNYQRLV